MKVGAAAFVWVSVTACLSLMPDKRSASVQCVNTPSHQPSSSCTALYHITVKHNGSAENQRRNDDQHNGNRQFKTEEEDKTESAAQGALAYQNPSSLQRGKGNHKVDYLGWSSPSNIFNQAYFLTRRSSYSAGLKLSCCPGFSQTACLTRLLTI